jgi:phosphoenolpyruvate-protein phosphotransferase (PTS system enzyme I)
MGKITLKGNSVSQGVGIGGIYVCKAPKIDINREKIKEDRVDGEIINLEVAVCKTYLEIYDLYNGFEDILSDEEKRILDIYNAILDDVYFFQELKDTVTNERITADHAIEKCMKKYILEIQSTQNDYAKQRISDLNDISVRLIKNIFPNNDVVNLENMNSSHIVFVKELNPTLAITLGKKKVQGVVAQEGAGYLSHASIILRGLGIPLVNGVEYERVASFHEHLAVVDGFEGTVLIEPNDPEINQYREIFRRDLLQKKEFEQDQDVPVETMDKVKVGLSVNISNIDDFRAVQNKNIDGIGLVRSETLLIQYRKLPSEMRQTMVYSGIAKGMKNKPVVIRTFDMGGDKSVMCAIAKEDWKKNSQRGIQWSLNHEDDFRIQCRSILKASPYGFIKISFPMVDYANDIIKAKEILEEEEKYLTQKGHAGVRKIQIGAVIESQKGVDNIKEILKVVDFISIGTNDLLQGILSCSRRTIGNEIREYFDPRFLKAIDVVVKNAKEHGVFVSVCGEMASDPLAAVVLIGLGIHDLSVAPSCVSYIKRTIRDLYYEVAKELVDRVLECDELEDVMKILSGFTDGRVS